MNGPGNLRNRTNVQVPPDLNENTYKDISSPNIYNISIARLQATAPLNITSFLGAVPNQLLRLIVEGPSAITIVDSAGGIGQIKTSSGANVILVTGKTYIYSYDSVNEWWSEETVTTASSVTGILTAGDYLLGSPFNGGSSVTWDVDADTANTPSTLVARDAGGDIYVGDVNASSVITPFIDYPTTITLGSVAGVIVTNNLQVNGNITTAGNLNVGNAITDTVNFTGRLNTNFIPLADITVDLGSTTLRFGNVYTRRVYSGALSLELYSAFAGSGGATVIYTGTNGFNVRSGTPSSSALIAEFPNSGAVVTYRIIKPNSTAANIDLAETGTRFRDGWFSRTVTAVTFVGALTGNADTATILQTARNINGTSFNGSADITTALWGTARTITIGATGKSVDGSGNVSWSLAEIGAGDVYGPGSSTDNSIVRFDGTTGKILQNSVVIISDAGLATGFFSIHVAGTSPTPLILERTSSGVNVSTEYRSTGSSVFVGHGAANTFAVRNNADLTTTPWFSVTSTTGTFSGELVVTGQLLSGVASHATGSPRATIGGGAIQLVLAENMTDATNKNGRIGFAHYTNAELPVAGLLLAASSAANALNIGGSSGVMNAATVIQIYTGATSTTPTGTLRASWNSSGLFAQVGNATIGGTLGVTGSVTLASVTPIIFSGTSDITLRTSTSDGTDTARILVTSGGSASTTRGALIALSGNENVTFPGRFYAATGDISTADWIGQIRGSTFISVTRPVSTNLIAITGQATFSDAATFSSALGVTGVTTLSGQLRVYNAATNLVRLRNTLLTADKQGFDVRIEDDTVGGSDFILRSVTDLGSTVQRVWRINHTTAVISLDMGLTIISTGAFTVNSGARFVSSATSNLFGTPTAATGTPRVDVFGTLSFVGTDTVTDATNKNARFAGRHYTNAEEVVAGLMVSTQTASNIVNIGGGSSAMNAATRVNIWTAANTITLTGTNVAYWDSTGLFTQVGSAVIGGTLSVTTSVTSPSFIGALTGNADTVTNGVYTTGSYADPAWITSLAYAKLTGAPSLTGYVTGPASATDNAVALYDSTTGKLIKNSVVIINAGAVSGITTLTMTPVANIVNITTNTSNGSDNAQLYLSSAGQGDITRGAFLQLTANEASGNGSVVLTATDGVSGVGANIFLSNTSLQLYTGSIGLSTSLTMNSSAIVLNEAGLSVDTRIEGNTIANLFFLDASQDNIGIGINPGTATFMHFAAGTTAKSSIRIELGVAPTTPVDGDIWNDGTQLRFYEAAASQYASWTEQAAVADATDAATVITQLNDLLAKLRTINVIAT